MPAVIGVYGEHPDTKELGIWLRTSWGGLVGCAAASLPAPTKLDTLETYAARVTDIIEQKCEYRSTKIAAPTINTEAMWYDTATKETVIEPLGVTVTFASLDPLVINTVTVTTQSTDPLGV